MKEKDKRIREWKMRGKLKNETFGKTQIVVFILCSLACFMFYVVSLSLSLAFVSGDIFCVILIYKGTLQQKNVTTAKDKLCERVKVFLSFDFKDLTAKVTESLLFCFIQSHWLLTHNKNEGIIAWLVGHSSQAEKKSSLYLSLWHSFSIKE